MDIHISDDRQRFIRIEIESGRYDSADEVLDTALRLLEERDRSSPGTPSEPNDAAADESRPRPIWEVAAELRETIPQDQREALPTDGADRHDHYIYVRARASGVVMRRVFADTYYWIALLNDKDQGHSTALAAGPSLGPLEIVTTQDVLSEVLAYFGGFGPAVRRMAATFVRCILADPALVVHPQSERSFVAGLCLYEARPDKG